MTARERSGTAIRFPVELHEALRAAAEEREVSINWLVNKAVADFLPRLLPVDEIVWTREPSDASAHYFNATPKVHAVGCDLPVDHVGWCPVVGRVLDRSCAVGCQLPLGHAGPCTMMSGGL